MIDITIVDQTGGPLMASWVTEEVESAVDHSARDRSAVCPLENV